MSVAEKRLTAAVPVEDEARESLFRGRLRTVRNGDWFGSGASAMRIMSADPPALERTYDSRHPDPGIVSMLGTIRQS
jgi:hypothetical protein